VTFQLCQIISYLSSWPHFWVGVINSRAGKCPPPLPLSQPGGKGEVETPLVSPCGHPWEAPPRSCEDQSRTLLPPVPSSVEGRKSTVLGRIWKVETSFPPLCLLGAISLTLAFSDSRSFPSSLSSSAATLFPLCFFHSFLVDQTLTLLSPALFSFYPPPLLPSLPKDTEHLSCSLNQTNSHHIPSHPIPSHPSEPSSCKGSARHIHRQRSGK